MFRGKLLRVPLSAARFYDAPSVVDIALEMSTGTGRHWLCDVLTELADVLSAEAIAQRLAWIMRLVVRQELKRRLLEAGAPALYAPVIADHVAKAVAGCCTRASRSPG